MSDTTNDDTVADATKTIHDQIDFNGSIPVDAKDPLHDITDVAGKLLHGVVDAGRDAAETAAIVAMETTDQIQHRCRQKTQAITGAGIAVLAILSIVLLAKTLRR